MERLVCYGVSEGREGSRGVVWFMRGGWLG
jgi:hypothetical protein